MDAELSGVDAELSEAAVCEVAAEVEAVVDEEEAEAEAKGELLVFSRSDIEYPERKPGRACKGMNVRQAGEKAKGEKAGRQMTVAD